MVWEIMWTEESMIHNHMLYILSILFRLIVWEYIVSLFIYKVLSAVFEVVVADREGDRFVKDTVRIGLLSTIQVFICFNGCSCLCDNYFGGHWTVLWEFYGRRGYSCWWRGGCKHRLYYR
jgi:hypothetical protein